MKGNTRTPRKTLIALLLVSGFGLTSCSTYTPYQGQTLPTTDTETKVATGQGGGTGGGGFGNVEPSVKGFVVQLIASSSSVRAHEIKDQYIKEGYKAFVTPTVCNKQTLYRVQIGPYAAEQDAEQLLKTMKERYTNNPLIMNDAFINENK